jgi:hypothetical protein
LKQLQEVVENELEHIGIENNFLNRTPVAQHLRENVQMELHQTKNFCTAKVTVTRLRRPPTEWVTIFASYSSE